MGIKNKQTGFTIVELLIVIVVVGILAAIVIVAFNGVQNRATEVSVKSDLANIHKKIEYFKANSPTHSYPNSPADLLAADIKVNKSSYLTPSARNLFYYCLGPAGESYTVGVASKQDKGFFMTDGKTVEVGTSASIYGGPTCIRAGWPTPPSGTSIPPGSSPQSGWASGAWADWVKG